MARNRPRFDRHSDGNLETYHYNFVYTPRHDVQGAVEGVMITAFDVTDEVRARSRMDALRMEAEAASRAKDEFLAMLGHELRNPLAPIVTGLRMMRLNGQHSREMEVVERQATHLTRLVDDLLDVSRITRRKVELRKQHIELADALDRALEIAQPLIEQRAQVVDIAGVARRGLCVHADPGRLAQIVSNLLTNAAKYSDSGSSIAVRAQRVGERVRLTVIDQGVGIAPEMIERVFELFVQQSQTIERSEGGLGLGLAIVRHLTELHGGSVEVVSAGQGLGSSFSIELPLASDHSVPDTARGESFGSTPVAAEPRRILVIDDNRDGAESMAFLLRYLGHMVSVAFDGPSGLALAEDTEPEFALIDIGLPGIDGFEVARRLRAKGGTTPLTLVAVTGYGLEMDRHLSAEAGFDYHLVKPVDLDEVIRLLAGDGLAT